MKRVLVLDGAFGLAVENLFKKRGYSVTTSIKDTVDAVVFTGGSDIDPSMYGEEKLKCTWSTPKRDAFESMVYELHQDLPKIGICRGGQFLNVKSGGSMWQDTDNHDYAHVSKTSDGRRFRSTSIHHQMMKPGEGSELLMVADVSTYVIDEKNLFYKKDRHFDDIEALYYDETKSLCYQGHPEVAQIEEQNYFFDLVHKYLNI